MDMHTANRLRALNNEFYNAHARSFSASRQSPWDGWDEVLALTGEPPRSVLDVACGNMRFKSFLDERFGTDAVRYLGMDSCPALVPEEWREHFEMADVLDGCSVGARGSFDLVACFGFMHHVPGDAARRDLLSNMLGACSPRGVVALSFWQFAKDPKRRAKAERTTAEGYRALGIDLYDGDFLLGWNDSRQSYRYCHSFTDDEADRIVSDAAPFASIVGVFHADGKTGDLNYYVVIRPFAD